MDRSMDSNAARGSQATAWAAALIVACGLAAYSNAFTDLFAGLDGKQSIRDNPHIQQVWPPSEALSLPMWTPPLDLAETPTVAHRPTFSLSLALTNALFGSKPRAHHAVNIAIHVAAALVLFGIVRRTISRYVGGEAGARAALLALAAALIWLVHPLQTESVTYIVQRAESLMGLLLFLSVYCALRAVDSPQRLRWQAGAVASCLLAAGCKETTIVVPLLVLLYDWTFVARAQAKWWRPGFYLALATAAWALPLSYAGKVATYVEGIRPLPFALAQPGVVLHYLTLFFWPKDLFLYVNTHVFDVSSPTQAVLPAVVLLVLLGATVVALVRRHWLGFVGAWFFVTLAPTSSVIPISDVIQEHRMYVPLAAPAVLVAAAGAILLRRVLAGSAERVRDAAGIVLLAAVVLALGARTYVRNRDYHHEFAMLHPADVLEDYTILADHYLSKPGLVEAEAERQRALVASPDADPRDVTFAHFVIGLAGIRAGKPQEAATELRSVVEAEPDFAYAHHHLGIALREAGDLPGAVAEFRTAVHLNPKLVYAHKELAVTLALEGDLGGAEQELEQALSIQPRFGEAFYELGILAARRGDKKAASDYYEDALDVRPDLPEPHFELAMLARERDDVDDAREHLEKAIALRPDYGRALRELGLLFEADGDRDAAIEHLERAVDARPDDVQAQHELGRLLMREKRGEEAADHLQRAIDLLEPHVRDHPRDVRSREELGTAETEMGMTLMLRGDAEQAVGHLRKAIEHRPDFAQAHTELGIALRARGDVGGAIQQFEEAIRLRPESPDAYKALGITLRESGDLERAAENFKKMMKIEPENADAYAELGEVREKQGDYAAAAAELEHALELRPDFPQARDRLASVRGKLGRGGARTP
jgi:tetratricopeptide (TPR) repeat protein